MESARVARADEASAPPLPLEKSATRATPAVAWKRPSPEVRSGRDGAPRAAPVEAASPRDAEPVRLASFAPSPSAGSGGPSRKSSFAQTLVEPDEVSFEDEGSTEADAEDFDPGPRRMNYIGFRQMADVSRIFVRIDGKARYRTIRRGAHVVLELVNTTVPVKNNTRPLDTSYFNSPVMKVQAVPSGANTRIEVRLRERVPFRVKRIGTTIALDFSRAG